MNNESPLHDAAEKGDLETLKALIASGCDVNALLDDGCTPLHLAVINGHYTCAEYLLQSGADPLGMVKESGFTPMHGAKANCAQLLYRYGAPIDIRDDNGGTPIHRAVYANDITLFQFFMDHNANLHSRDHSGDNLLHSLARGHDIREEETLDQASLELLKLLIEHKLDINSVNNRGQTPCFLANAHLLKALLTYHPDLRLQNEYGHNVFHNAVAWGYHDRIRILLDHDPSLIHSLTSDGKSGLYIGLGIPNLDGRHPLLVIDGIRNVQLGMTLISKTSVDLLIERGIDVNLGTKKPLNYVARMGDLEMVQLLLQHQADPDLVDQNGQLPYQNAILNDHFECLKLLIERMKGTPDYNLQIERFAPLECALYADNTELFQFLIEGGAEITDHIRGLSSFNKNI